MKKFNLTLILTLAMALGATAQQTLYLSDIIADGKSGETYIVDEDLLGVYVPPSHPNVIFAKDYNGYAAKSHPTQEQYDAGHLFDESDGTLTTDSWGNLQWEGSFDQSNWVKIVFPEGVDATQYESRVIKSGTLTGVVNVQSSPCSPLGLTLTVKEGMTLPTAGDNMEPYQPNTYCTCNFVMQPEWYFVKPQNQEFALIHWAVYHQADKKFYVPAKNGDINGYGLKGSFPVSMALWEDQPGIDPDEVFRDEYLYEDFPAIIEFRTGENFTLNIDPGFTGDYNYIYDAPRRLPIGEGGETPYFTDKDGGVHYYTVMVYPLSLPNEGVITAVNDVRSSTRTVASVRYTDAQGRTSTQPHRGFNVVTTTYTDGTTAAEKRIIGE